MKSLFFLLFLLLSVVAVAQINLPPSSPLFEIKGTVGFAEVKVVYSGPSARGRKVAGNLIPYNEVWRTGANASTKISFTDEVKIDGHPVAAGTYALYTLFTEEKATIILSKDLSLWGSIGYDQKNDVLRFDVPVKHTSSHYETFTFSFSDVTTQSANLNLKWENIKVMFNIESEVDSRVMAEIETKVIKGKATDANTLYYAAEYYYTTERDPRQALDWISSAIAASDKEQYWIFLLQARLQARLKMNKEAIATAKKSIELSRAAGNMDYVRLNEQLIAAVK